MVGNEGSLRPSNNNKEAETRAGVWRAGRWPADGDYDEGGGQGGGACGEVGKVALQQCIEKDGVSVGERR